MLDAFGLAVRTLEEHFGAALWALAVFAAGFLLALPVVRLDVRSLLAFPTWLMRLAKKYMRPDTSPVFMCAFIFLFNSVAIFCYMLSGGLLFLPFVFDLLTGLHVGVIMLKDVQEPRGDLAMRTPPPRAWLGFLGIFVVVVELSAFWFSIGMGMELGRAMGARFAWATFIGGAEPRVLAYALIVVPALALSAVAETAAIKVMLRDEG